MIIILDPTCISLQHTPFNAGLLSVVSLAHPDEEIVFCAEKSHIDEVYSLLAPELREHNIYKPLEIPEFKAPFFKRIKQDILNIKKCFRFFKKGHENRLLICNVKPSVFVALRMALLTSTVDRNKLKIHVVLHANATALDSWRSRNPLLRIQDMVFAVRFVSNLNIQYIVLEHYIKDELKNKVSYLGDRISVLEHPIIENKTDLNTKHINYHGLKFGFLGGTFPKKGFDSYLGLAQEIESEYGDKAQFYVVGSLDARYMDDPRLKYLSTEPSSQKLARADYEIMLDSLDYVIMPYDSEYYSLCPSGALLDAIAWVKPIIAFRIPLFSDIEKRFGPIGFLCKDSAEMVDTIKQIIISPDNEQYKLFVQNLKQVKKSRTPTALAPVYAALD